MNGHLAQWIIETLLALVIALAVANLAMTSARLDRIEDKQQSLIQRLNSWYGQLAERLARIEAKLE